MIETVCTLEPVMSFAILFALVLGACVISFGLLWLGSRLDRTGLAPESPTTSPASADDATTAGEDELEINPATMLPMVGGTDMKGNLYLQDRDRDDESVWKDHRMIGDQTDWDRPDYGMGSDDPWER